MILFSILILIPSYFLYFFRRSFLSELAISFLPYIGGVLLVFVIYWLIRFGKYVFFSKNNRSRPIKYSIIFLLLFGIIFAFYTHEMNCFYNHVEIFSKNTPTSPIKILYSNIYKSNYNFESIKQIIEDESPDIAMFVEFSDEHEDGLDDFISEYFPYHDKTNRSRIYGGNVVMSKYPITNFIDQFEQAGAWKYGYFMIEKDNTPYYFYLIHTSSPVSKFDFFKRNQQLNTIKEDFFANHDKERDPNAKIIMLGDFNISPWSSYYKDFFQSFSGKLLNITSTPSIFFSRSLSEMLKIHEDFELLPSWLKKYISYVPFFWSHIDQAFISPNLNLYNFKKIHIDGSDHDGIVFEVE